MTNDWILIYLLIDLNDRLYYNHLICATTAKERERAPFPSTLPRLMKCSGPKPNYLIDQQTIESILWQFLLNDPTRPFFAQHVCNFTPFKWVLFFQFCFPSLLYFCDALKKTNNARFFATQLSLISAGERARRHLLSTLQCLLTLFLH